MIFVLPINNNSLFLTKSKLTPFLVILEKTFFEADSSAALCLLAVFAPARTSLETSVTVFLSLAVVVLLVPLVLPAALFLAYGSDGVVLSFHQASSFPALGD